MFQISYFSRMFTYLTFKEKKRILARSYFESQFKYCPLVWMFYGRKMINCLHERAVRMIYDSTSSLVSFRQRDNSFSVHDCNIQQLAMEMYIEAHGLASKAKSVLFLQNNMQTW